EPDAFIQLLVRNTDCILGSWLVDPIEETGDVEEGQLEIDPGGGEDPEGGEGLPLDDEPGAAPGHAQGGAGDPRARRGGGQAGGRREARVAAPWRRSQPGAVRSGGGKTEISRYSEYRQL